MFESLIKVLLFKSVCLVFCSGIVFRFLVLLKKKKPIIKQMDTNSGIKGR